MADVTINTVVANNRKPLSIIGANLGTMYFKAGARAGIPNFDDIKLGIERNGNIDFCLNRTPRRYRMMGHDIVSVQVGLDPTGASNVYINKGDEESEVILPITPDMTHVGKVEEEAIAKALKGDKDIIFSDAKKLATTLNAYNVAEKTRLLAFIGELQKCVQQLDGAINENNKKADAYEKEYKESSPSSDDTVVIVNS